MKTINYLLIFILPLLTSCTETRSKPGNDSTKSGNYHAKVYTTTKGSDLRISKTAEISMAAAYQPLENEISVFVNPDVSFQKFLGIGGAVTDASAEVFATLPPDKQDELLNAYYSVDAGIGYSLVRTPIHSCDFSSGSYTYIDEGDADLKSFNIDHDRRYKIPLLRKIKDRVKGELVLYASPWSPPAFMKDNNSMLQGGKLLTEYYKPWALYYTRFIEEYEKEGLDIWGLTIQNEPMATQRWESCIYTAEEERDFLKYYLGPTLREKGFGNKKIIIWDHNRDLINHRAHTILADDEASSFVWGVGFHWYETWAGGKPMFQNLADVKQSFPDKNLIFTEGCAESFHNDHMQNWSNAERYGESMIFDFNNGTVGWTDWNIILDQQGGPNHVGNYCFAPVHANTSSGEIIYTPSYYYIGHFSKFIRPDARRISCVSSRSHLLSTSFLNLDNSIITVVMNKNDEPIEYGLYIGSSFAKLPIQPHSIQTIVSTNIENQ